MSENKTKDLRKMVLDHVFGQIEYSFPANIYLVLFSASPTDEGLFTNELSQGGYTRVAIKDLMSAASRSTGSITNAEQIQVGPASEDWPEVTYIGLSDTSIIGDGTLLYFGPPFTTRRVDTGDYFRIPVGQLVVTER